MRGGLGLVMVLAACDSGARPTEPVPQMAQAPQVPLALALVVNAQEIVAGNRDYETDENAAYEGIYPALRASLREQPLRLPAGSQTMVIGHDADSVRVLGDTLDAAVFDPLHARGRMGANMPAGVTLALDQLSRIDAERRVLFVVGDTHSTDRGHVVAFPALRQYADALDVETTILLWQLDCFGAASWDKSDHWFAGLFQTIDIGGGKEMFGAMLAKALLP